MNCVIVCLLFQQTSVLVWLIEEDGISWDASKDPKPIVMFGIVVLCTLVWLVDVLGEYCLLPHLGLSPTGLIRIAKMKAKKVAKPQPTSTEYLPDILKPGYLATIELTPVDRAV